MDTDAIPAHHIRHPRRLAQYRMGRVLARLALEAMTGRRLIPTRDEGGRPNWPAHTVGSITHTNDLAAAVVAPARQLAGIGIDAEEQRQLSPAAQNAVCTPAEQARPAQSPVLAFSAKEAIYKTLDPLGIEPLRFQDVTVIESSGQLHFSATDQCGWADTLKRLHGVSLETDDHVLTVVWLEQDAGQSLV